MPLETHPGGVEWEDSVAPETAARPALRPVDGRLAGARPGPRPHAVAAPSAGAVPATGGVAGRRTITIQGRGAERNLPLPSEASRRRAARRAHERSGFRPDRAAMWAVLLGLLLVLVALTSAHP